QVDMLAAGLTNTPARRQRYRFSPSYYHTAHTLVYRKGRQKPRDMSQVEGNLSVLAGSAQAEWLAQLAPPTSALAQPFSGELGPAPLSKQSPALSAALSAAPLSAAKAAVSAPKPFNAEPFKPEHSKPEQSKP